MGITVLQRLLKTRLCQTAGLENVPRFLRENIQNKWQECF